MKLYKQINHGNLGVVIGEGMASVGIFILFSGSMDFQTVTKEDLKKFWKPEKGDAEKLFNEWKDSSAIGKTTDAIDQLLTMKMIADKAKTQEKPLPLATAKVTKLAKGQDAPPKQTKTVKLADKVEAPAPVKLADKVEAPAPVKVSVKDRIKKIAEEKKLATPVKADEPKAEAPAEKPAPKAKAPVVKAAPKAKAPAEKPAPKAKENVQKRLADAKKAKTEAANKAEVAKAKTKALKTEAASKAKVAKAQDKAKTEKADSKKTERKGATIRERILAVLGKRPMTVAEIATAIGEEGTNAIRQALFKAKNNNEVKSPAPGTYTK